MIDPRTVSNLRNLRTPVLCEEDDDLERQVALEQLNSQIAVLDDLYSRLCDATEALDDIRSQARNIPGNYFEEWQGKHCSVLYDSLTGDVEDSVVLYMNSYINEVEELKDAINSARSYLRSCTYGNSTLGQIRSTLDGLCTYIGNLIN